MFLKNLEGGKYYVINTYMKNKTHDMSCHINASALWTFSPTSWHVLFGYKAIRLMTAVKDKVKNSWACTGTNVRIHTHSPFSLFRHATLILWLHTLFLQNAFSPPLECQVAEKIQVIIILIITLQVINFYLMKVCLKISSRLPFPSPHVICWAH